TFHSVSRDMKNIRGNFCHSIGNGKVSRASVWLTAMGACCLLAGCATGVKDTSRTFTAVVIDAGHGGYDNGAATRYGGREKDANLDVAMRLRPKLEAAGFRTVMTRSSD